MSELNREVPDFSVFSYHNGLFTTVKKADILNKWSIFFFYPSDFSLLCPTELVDLADNYEEFKKLNAEVYSISTDSHLAHKAWCCENEDLAKISFPMLSDSTHTLSKAFNVLNETTGKAERATFIINPEGFVLSYEVNIASVGRNSDEILRKLSALVYVREHGDRGCPAKWRAGKETIDRSLNPKK